MTNLPSLIRSVSTLGEVRYRLGDPLVDRYLEFVAGRARPNTLRAVASDLKAFFTVVAKDRSRSSRLMCSSSWPSSAVIGRWWVSRIASQGCPHGRLRDGSRPMPTSPRSGRCWRPRTGRPVSGVPAAPANRDRYPEALIDPNRRGADVPWVETSSAAPQMAETMRRYLCQLAA
jgi:hypothetical protein